MKKFIVITIALMSTSPAFAALTKGQALELAAIAVIETGQGNRVETCDGISDQNELLSCVLDNTGMDLKVSRLSDSAKLKGNVKFTYLDSSGDCALDVAVEAKHAKVAYVSDWFCN